MNIVLLSGGSGRRLWPLSNDIRSKQFIKIFKTENGGYQSMVQRVYGQLKSVMPDAAVTIATSKSQVSAIINQLGDDVGISVEPCRRDTFPAIALAAAYLADVQEVDPHEPVVVCPVDPYVEDDYFHALKSLGEQAAAGEANLVLMGIEPTYPSEKYGYIIPESQDSVSSVRTFREKPDEATARQYIEQGALWNGGIFAFRLSYLLDKAHELIDYSDYSDLYQKYGELEKISFDYAVVEQEKSIQVMRFGGQWKDLGTWNTLSEAMEESCIGDAVLEDTCENVHVINELGMPVLALGLHDVVISASPEGILVSDKERSSHIKPLVEKISRQVMFAEKSWGSYRVLDADGHSLTIRVTLNPGKSMNYHSHRHRDEVWVVTSGHGRALIDDRIRNIRAGDVLSMSAGCRHTVFADTELKLVEVQLGEEISVSDKEKHQIRPDSRCFGGADIRGIYPLQVNEELACRIGRYFPEVIGAGRAAKGRGRIAVGCDVRLSSPALKKGLIRGLTEAGCDVLDIGRCGTEMMYFAVAHLKLEGGIMVTASHNSGEYNGFKLVRQGAVPVSGASGLRELERLCAAPPEQKGSDHEISGKATSTTANANTIANTNINININAKTIGNTGEGRRGSVQPYDILPEYTAHILGYVDVNKLAPMRIVVNAFNGAAGAVLDSLEGRLPFEFIRLNCQPDGRFPNGVPNPMLNENREAVSRAVREYHADMGIAWDGDFDRCFIFDEEGMMIEGYYMVGLLAEAFLRKHTGARIIHDARVYWNTQDICRQNGGEAVMCRSGHSFIKEKMRQVDAVYGGEMSSHHYFRDFAYCDSGMIPWLLVAELLSVRGLRASQLVNERLRQYPCSGEINTRVESSEQAEELIQRVEVAYGAGGSIDRTDGLTIEHADWRFNIRRSNTEPVIRLNVEARNSKALLTEKVDGLLNIIRK